MWVLLSRNGDLTDEPWRERGRTSSAGDFLKNKRGSLSLPCADY
jgi:hypothetical protein